MKVRLMTIGAMTAAAALLPWHVKAESKVAVHGSVQADILFPQKDASIGADQDYDSPILFNTYAGVNLASKFVDAGLRVEFMR